MQLEITPELAELRAALRRFTTEVLEPLALEIDQTGEVPTMAWDIMRAQGYLGMRMPAQFGGGDVDLSTYCLALEEFSRSHRIFTLMLDATSGLNPIAIAKFGTPGLTPNVPPITRVLNLVTQHEESYRQQDLQMIDIARRLASIEERQMHGQDLLGSLRVSCI